jgi:hypothetical protein
MSLDTARSSRIDVFASGDEEEDDLAVEGDDDFDVPSFLK